MQISIRNLTLLPLLSLLAVLLPAPGFVPSAHALSCVGFTVEESYEKYDAVIVGQVNGLEPVGRQNDRIRAEVAVIKSFKTIEDKQITALENATWGAGHAPSEVGEQYLMYLNRTPDGWEQPLCSPGRQISYATEELKWLADKEIPLQALSANGDKGDEPASNDGGGVPAQQQVSPPMSGGLDAAGQSAADDNGSRMALAGIISAFAVLAGIAVWVYAARNRKGRNS